MKDTGDGFSTSDETGQGLCEALCSYARLVVGYAISPKFLCLLQFDAIFTNGRCGRSPKSSVENVSPTAVTGSSRNHAVLCCFLKSPLAVRFVYILSRLKAVDASCREFVPCSVTLERMRGFARIGVTSRPGCPDLNTVAGRMTNATVPIGKSSSV